MVTPRIARLVKGLARRADRWASVASAQQYRLCRDVFAEPYQAHLALSGVRTTPYTLTLRSGATLEFPPIRRVQWLWSFLAADPTRLRSVDFEGELLTFLHEGVRYCVRPASLDFVMWAEVFLYDTYRLLRHRPPRTVIDLGANVGLFSTRAVQLGARRVIALEPVAANRKIAERHFAAAQVESEVTLLEQAVGRRAATGVPFYLSGLNHGGHSTRRSLTALQDCVGEARVETITIEQLFEQHALTTCDLLKCDVEGAEFEVVASAPVELLRRIGRIALEAHLTQETPRLLLDRLLARLRLADFDCEVVDGPTLFGGRLQPVMVYATRPAAVSG